MLVSQPIWRQDFNLASNLVEKQASCAAGFMFLFLEYGGINKKIITRWLNS